MADKLFTAEEFATWIPARDVYQRAQAVYGAQAASTILSRCANGLMRGRAENMFVGSGSRRKEYGLEALIPTFVWEDLDTERYQSTLTLWNTNAIELEIRPDGASMHTANIPWRLFGIRFDPVTVDKMMPPKVAAPVPVIPPAQPASQSAPAPAPAPHPGGRPKKDYWEELWAHLAAQIYAGKLDHKKQSNIEKAMLEWAEANGHELSEQSARARARVLKAALDKEDKN